MKPNSFKYSSTLVPLLAASNSIIVIKLKQGSKRFAFSPYLVYKITSLQ